ncbi:MAG: antibiotic biosynthesis monooxygenase [Mycobacteriaceae bacterium]
MAVVKINAIEVPEGAGEQLEARFAARAAAVEGAPGFLGFELLRPTGTEPRYFVYTRWESEQAYQAWASDGAPAAHAGPAGRAPVATGATLLSFDVVMHVEPSKC